jgi:hypothetical protein
VRSGRGFEFSTTARNSRESAQLLFQLNFNKLHWSVSHVFYASLFDNESHEIVIL